MVAANRETRGANSKLKEELKALQEKLAAIEKANAPKGPDPAEDPTGALLHRIDGLNSKIEGIEAKSTEERLTREQAEQQRAHDVKVLNYVRASEDRFAQTQPDYKAAFSFGFQQRMRYHQALGVPDDQLQATVLDELRGHMAMCLENNLDPARQLYNLATAMGWNPAMMPKTDLETAAEGGEESGSESGSDDDEDSEAIAALDAMSRGKAAGVAPKGGTSTPKGLTLEQYVAMSREDQRKVDPAVKKRLLGG